MNPKEAAARGWFVFPLTITHDESACDGGTANCKRLKFQSNWRSTSTTDPAIIDDWPAHNGWGIDCGRSGLMVVDEDPGADWPHEAQRVHSSGRGRHYLYRAAPGARNGTHLRPWGIDIRADGGLIVGPGSWHPHGIYAVLVDGEPGEAPPELLEALRRRREVTPADAEPLDALEALDRIRGVYERVAGAQVGTRNDTLNRMAGAAAGLWVRLAPQDQTGQLAAEHITARLLESVPDDDDPAGSAATVASGWRYGLEHPISDVPDTSHIFAATPTLAHIERAAHSIGRGAMPMLCFVLARVLAATPPSLVLPGGQDGVIGSRASLNLGFALTARSGGGKTDVSEMSEQLLGLDQSDIQRTPSSGEGLIQSFLDKDNNLIDDPRRLFNVDEIEHLQQVTGRSGATLGAILRTMLTGGQIGTENATAGLRRNLKRGTYRMIVAAGVQPALSGALLNEQRSGLPQRFVWAWAVDPNVPHPDERPDWPGPITVRQVPEDFMDTQVIDYPDWIKQQVRLADWERAKDTIDDSTSHLMLTRLKVAAALALLHWSDGPVAITDQWWSIAGDIIDASEQVQEVCRAELARASQAEVTRAAMRQAQATETVADDRLERAVNVTLANLRRRSEVTEGPVPWRDVRPPARYRWEGFREDILDGLRQHGVTITERKARNGETAYDLTLNVGT